jgi:hypothetical protein
MLEVGGHLSPHRPWCLATDLQFLREAQYNLCHDPAFFLSLILLRNIPPAPHFSQRRATAVSSMQLP